MSMSTSKEKYRNLNVVIKDENPELLSFCNRISYYITDMYKKFIAKDAPHLNYCGKQSPEQYNRDKKNAFDCMEFGYFVNTDIYHLHLLIKHFKCEKIADMGSGAGLLMQILRCLNESLNIRGFENETVLVEIAKKLESINSNSKIYTIYKDITKLLASDVNDLDAVYFWEPLINTKLIAKFISKLETHLKVGTYIFYRPAGPMRKFMEDSRVLKYVGDYSCYRVYIKK